MVVMQHFTGHPLINPVGSAKENDVVPSVPPTAAEGTGAHGSVDEIHVT